MPACKNRLLNIQECCELVDAMLQLEISHGGSDFFTETSGA